MHTTLDKTEAKTYCLAKPELRTFTRMRGVRRRVTQDIAMEGEKENSTITECYPTGRGVRCKSVFDFILKSEERLGTDYWWSTFIAPYHLQSTSYCRYVVPSYNTSYDHLHRLIFLGVNTICELCPRQQKGPIVAAPDSSSL